MSSQVAIRVYQSKDGNDGVAQLVGGESIPIDRILKHESGVEAVKSRDGRIFQVIPEGSNREKISIKELTEMYEKGEFNIIRTYSSYGSEKHDTISLDILYQAKRNIRSDSVKVIVNCFGKDGNQMEGTSIEIPSTDSLARGEVRRKRIILPVGAVSYEIMLSEN